MSAKNKLSLYLTTKSTAPTDEISNRIHISTINTEEIVQSNERDDNSSALSTSLITTCFESRHQDRETLNVEENIFTTTRTDNRESLTESPQINSFKHDPGRGPEAAKEFYYPIHTNLLLFFQQVSIGNFVLAGIKFINGSNLVK